VRLKGTLASTDATFEQNDLTLMGDEEMIPVGEETLVETT